MAPESNPMKNFTTDQLKIMLGVKSPSNFKPSAIMDFGVGSSFDPTSNKAGASGPINYQSYNYYGYGNTYPSNTVPESYDVRDKYPQCQTYIKD